MICHLLENITFLTLTKLRKLVTLLANGVPFKVNISELSRKINISRDVLERLLPLLDRVNLIISAINQKGVPTGHLTKSDKICHKKNHPVKTGWLVTYKKCLI